MPNVPPNGLWGRETATAADVPEAVFGLLDDGDDWRVADFVWTWDEVAEEWVVIWSRTAGSPASVLAEYSNVTHQVTLTITPDDPSLADQFRVYRPDGSTLTTVDSSTLVVVDAAPRPGVDAYSVAGLLGTLVDPTPTDSNALDLSAQPTDFAADVVGQTVTLSWTNPTLLPQQWRIYRNGSLLATIDSDLIEHVDASGPRGALVTYEIAPYFTAAGQVGTKQPAVAAIPANVPASVTLTAPSSPINTLRLSWVAPSGSVTGYEVETSDDGVGWDAHGDDDSPSDWTTGVAGYMRVRSLSDGGSSGWVERGPQTPVTDVTPPGEATITSWKPESSYGRMVLRATLPADVDQDQYQLQYQIGAGSIITALDWTNGAPGATISRHMVTGVAGNAIKARVNVRDEMSNTRIGAWSSVYTLVTSPTIVDPQGDLSGTWRTDQWRNDATRSSTEIATGWTTSGHNMGVFIYNDAIDAALGSRTITSASIAYWREDEGGNSAAIQPLFWTHNKTSRSAGAPVLNAHGVAESSRLGSAVARHTLATSGSWSLPSAFIAALQAGTAKGLAMYRGYQGSGSPWDSYYMLIPPGGDVGGSPTVVTNGRLTFHHLG